MTPFWLPPLIAIACGAFYVIAADSGNWPKVAVCVAVALSLLLQRAGALTAPWAIGLVLQAGVSICVILHFKPPTRLDH